MIILRKNKRSTVYLMCGISGAGKSTWVKNNCPNLEVISRDIIRCKLGYLKTPEDRILLTPRQEQNVTRVEYNKINELLQKHENFVIDDMNISSGRIEIIKLLRKENAFIIGVNINTPLKICIERRKEIPAEVLTKMYNKRKKLTKYEVDKVINVFQN